MTQDQYGQARGPGYVVPGEVVSGEVVPDDENGETRSGQTTPMTRFQKVASALRGDRPDDADQADQAAAAADPLDATDPNGTWPGPGATAATTAGPDLGTADPEATLPDGPDPEDMGAVRSPDAGNYDYWDDDQATSPAPGGQDPAVGGQGPAGALGSAPDGQGPAGTLDPTATQPSVYGGTAGATAPAGATGVAWDARPTGTTEADAVAAGASGSDVAGASAADAGVAGVAGKHAGVPADAELRPGETDPGLADFSDLTYGSLLPDAAEFTAKWQHVQFRFVDDPKGSVTEAADVIAQVTAKLEAAIQERQRAISERQRDLRGRWSEGMDADTESLRGTLLMYRAFLDQLTGSRTG